MQSGIYKKAVLVMRDRSVLHLNQTRILKQGSIIQITHYEGDVEEDNKRTIFLNETEFSSYTGIGYAK